MTTAISRSIRVNVRPGYWRLTLQARIERLTLQAELATLDSSAKERALEHLANAQVLTDDPQNPIEVWSGSQVETAWTELRLAEESLLQGALQPADIKANARQALTHAKERLPDGDARVTALTDALASKNLAEIKAYSLKVTEASHEVSDEQHRAQREFRNRLRNVTAGLLLLAMGAAVTAILAPIPPGWVPKVEGATAPGHAIVGALILGAAGALFSAVPSLSQGPPNTTTFNPVVEQAMLKIVVGSWSAVVGMAAVAAGIQTSDTNPATPAGFAMMCALFGAMQEAITRFADHRASETKPTTS